MALGLTRETIDGCRASFSVGGYAFLVHEREVAIWKVLPGPNRVVSWMPNVSTIQEALRSVGQPTVFEEEDMCRFLSRGSILRGVFDGNMLLVRSSDFGVAVFGPKDGFMYPETVHFPPGQLGELQRAALFPVAPAECSEPWSLDFAPGWL